MCIIGRTRSGFSLIELAAALFVAILMVSVVVPAFYRGFEIETARNMSAEVIRLTEAVRAYRSGRHAWPADIAELQAAGFVPSGWSGRNPFGREYRLVPLAGGMSLETDLPAAVAPLLGRSLPMASVEGGHVTVGVMADSGGQNSLPVGSLISWPSAVIPDGWLLCYGQEVSRTEYADLFAAIGTVFGEGDGSTTFRVPDMRGRVAVGLDDMGGSVANVILHPSGRVLGGRLGAEKHTLTVSEMPAHGHNLYDYTFSENQGRGGSAQGNAESLDYDNVPAVPYYHPTENAGGGQAHNNMQPSLALNWIVRAR